MISANSRHQEKLNPQKIRIINLISFLLGLSESLGAYVLSSYIKEVTHSDNVSLFYLISYSVILLATLNLHKLVRLVGKSYAYFIFLSIQIIAMAVLANISVSMFGIILLGVSVVATTLKLVLQDILLESFSADKLSGRIRGFNLTILNLGFLLGPSTSIKILSFRGFQGIFMVQSVLYIIIFFIAILNLRKVNHRFDPVISVKTLVNKAFRRSDIMGVYYIAFILDFFYALLVPYTPLYLLELGYSWGDISKIFTAMLLPFVMLEYPVGVLADKKWGEKELMILSIVIMSVSTGMIYFLGGATIAIWAMVLFATRIGAALLEILRDSYFYKRIDGCDVDIIGFFRTSRPTAYIVASMISVVMLSYFSLKSIFILVSIVIFTAIVPALRLRDNKAEEEACKF